MKDREVIAVGCNGGIWRVIHKYKGKYYGWSICEEYAQPIIDELGAVAGAYAHMKKVNARVKRIHPDYVPHVGHLIHHQDMPVKEMLTAAGW
jgi:hypothetical protein